eukprot:5610192-Pleurochrysis_carterae.AAC.1
MAEVSSSTAFEASVRAIASLAAALRRLTTACCCASAIIALHWDVLRHHCMIGLVRRYRAHIASSMFAPTNNRKRRPDRHDSIHAASSTMDPSLE